MCGAGRSSSGGLAGVTIVFLPRGPSAHELRVALRPRHYDIHPDPHGLRGRSHHVVEAVVGFHTEGQRWIRALEDRRQTGTCFSTKLHLLHLFPQR